MRGVLAVPLIVVAVGAVLLITGSDVGGPLALGGLAVSIILGLLSGGPNGTGGPITGAGGGGTGDGSGGM